MTNAAIVNAPNLYVDGLIPSLPGGSMVVPITAGAARDSTNVNDIIAPIPLMLNLEASGVNGIDTGVAVANTFYAIYVIGDSTHYAPTAVLASLDFLSPVIPGGYDMFRRIGSLYVVPGPSIGGSYISGNNTRREISFAGIIPIISGFNATTPTIIDLSGVVPPFVYPVNSQRVTEVKISIAFTSALPSHVFTISGLVGRVVGGGALGAGGAPTTFNTTLDVITGSPARLLAAVSNTADSVTLACYGYVDYL